MKRIISLFFVLACLLTVSLTSLNLASANINPAATPDPNPEADKAAVEQAIRKAISLEAEYVLAYLLYTTEIDRLALSTDGAWATAWLNPVDPETNRAIPAEPGLALAWREGEEWQVVLQSDPDWASKLIQAPADLMPAEDRTAWLDMYAESSTTAVDGPFGGYLLPWAAGKKIILTRSILHYNPPDPTKDMHYAFDFAARWDASGTSPMFEVYASRAGTVKYARWSQENGSENSPGNYLVLEDTSTSPITYQLYLHLAKDSIPPVLRTAGTFVLQGQYLGLADDTGNSTGNHLHFQVHTNPKSYWGKSVDIRFEDVSINGGRPRTPGEAKYFPEYGNLGLAEYTSGNQVKSSDTLPPAGDILEPVHGITVGTDTIRLQGWAEDALSGLASARFLANYNGAWQPVGSEFSTSPFGMDWNLCADGVPDGPVSLMLELRDRSHNQATNFPGLRHFSKNTSCPLRPPACVPAENQAALFAGPDYSGACAIFGSGSYTSTTALGAVGEDHAASILVGATVQATLFADGNLRGRGEAFRQDDSNLEDNRIGAGTVSSLLVQARSASPNLPVLNWPANGAVFSDKDSLSLAWDNGGGAVEYQVEWNGSLLPWQRDPFLHLGSVAAGSYTWRVKARNASGATNWSASRTLQVEAGTANQPGLAPVGTPYSDNMETSLSLWSAGANWAQASAANHTADGATGWKYGGSTGYDTGAPNSGGLTSPPVAIPAEGEYFLRFWYLYDTEGPGVHWDQRWVQISVDGGPFTNTLQLSDDPREYWLQSPAISLAAYSGRTVQIRFYFTTLDSASNSNQGWYIDDFSITATPPPACSEAGGAHSTPAQAREIPFAQIVNGEICPAGEIDFYKFPGTAGDQIGAVIEAQSAGSTLDATLYLIDSDGASVLAHNDDQATAERKDPFLTYRIPRTSSYYIKVKAWDHPTGGGSSYAYKLQIHKESEKPSGAFIYPKEGAFLPAAPIVLSVSASDQLSGISRVEFLWHAADWLYSDWELVGSDWDGQDGWSHAFDATNLRDLAGLAFYARIYDWAGNWTGAGVWNLRTLFSFLYLPQVYKAPAVKSP